MKRIIPVLIFLLPSLTAASEAKCKVISATEASVYSPFVGGKIFIDLENGNVRLVQGGTELFPITAEKVSSFQAARDSCNYGWEKILYSDGALRAALYKFNDCRHGEGYVRAEAGFDLKSNTGLYQEVYLNPIGESPYFFVEYSGCAILK
jgi:hypothetical protein